MESISQQEIKFLIAVMASEESVLQEVVWEFDKWDCQQEDVLNLFKGLVRDGIILLYKPMVDGSSDLSKEETLEAIETWEALNRKDVMLFLTNAGEKRWENDDWGITTKRAHHLMFSKPGNITRVKG